MFIELLKAHKLLWAFIMTGDFSLVEDSKFIPNFRWPTHFTIENVNLSEQQCFSELVASKEIEGVTNFPKGLTEAEFQGWHDKMEQKLYGLDKNFQDYDKIRLILRSNSREFINAPEQFFDKKDIMTYYRFDPVKKDWSNVVKKHIIEYPNEQLPIKITMRPFQGGTIFYIDIYKKGTFKSHRQHYEAFKDVNPKDITTNRFGEN